MKLSKLLVGSLLAAVGLAVSGAASAQVNSSDLLVVIYDPNSGDLLVSDLGTSYITSPEASQVVAPIGGYSGFYSTVSAVSGFNAANLQWSVLGAGSSLLIDLAQTVGTVGHLTTSTAGSVFGTTLAGFQADVPSGTSAVVSFGTSGSPFGPQGNFAQSALDSVIDPNELYTFTGISSKGSTAVALDPLSASLGTTSATITIGTATSPTPEPGTYALMAAGLLAVGAIVRRRARR